MKRIFLVLSLIVLGGAFVFAQAQKTPIETYNPGFVFPKAKINLTYWHSLEGRPGYHELAMEMADEYTKIHPNVTIEVRKIPNSQQRAIWVAAFESHTAPDVVWIETQVGLLAKGLRVAPSWAVKMIESTFTPYAASLSRINGKYYGWSGAEVDAGQMLYYNKDMFRAAGLDPNKPPKNMTEFLDYAKKLTQYDSNGNIKVAGVALRYSGGNQGIGDKFSKYAMPFMDTTKKFYYNADFTDVMFDSPEWLEASKYVRDLVFKHKVTNTTLPIPDQAVAQGLAAMSFRESFYANFLKENAPNTEFGIAPFPTGKYPTGAIPWLATTGVSTDSKNPDVAWDFAMFMANEKNELRMAKNNGGFSRLKAFQNDPFFKTLPYFDTYKAMTEQRPLVQNPYLDPNALQAELEAKLGEVVVQILTDPNADTETLLKDLASYGRKRLQESKK